MLHTLPKPLSYSGVVKLGSVLVSATWDVIEDTCLMLRIVGLLSTAQLEALADYRVRNTTIRVQLPGRPEFRVEVVGYDRAKRSFCLSIQG